MMLLEGKAELDTQEPRFCKMRYGLTQTSLLLLSFSGVYGRLALGYVYLTAYIEYRE